MRIRGAKVEVALPSGAKAPDTPTRSEAQMTSGVEGRTTMRSVALDLGRKISFCEVANDEVTSRATARSINELERQLGPETAPARVAFEACREGWFIDRRLREWGHEPLMVDTTRCRQLGIGQHRKKTDRIDAEVLARAVERGRIPLAHVLSTSPRSAAWPARTVKAFRRAPSTASSCGRAGSSWCPHWLRSSSRC